MGEVELKQIEELLGVRAPWHVEGIEVDASRKEVVIRVRCERTAWATEEGLLHVHQWERRRWRHLDLWQCVTIIEAEVPRLKDPVSGKTETVTPPWAERLSRWTRGFEAHAIEILLSTRSVKDASRVLRLGWEGCDAIMKSAVKRGLERRRIEGLEKVGLDEKSFRRGQDYIALMVDLLGERVLEVVEGADQEAVEELWRRLPAEQRGKVKAAAMDRGKAMVAGTRVAAPQVEIVHDKYHISAEQNKALDAVRRRENKELLGQGDDTLVGTRFHWLARTGEAAGRGVEEF